MPGTSTRPPAWRRWTVGVGLAEAGGIAVAAGLAGAAAAVVGEDPGPGSTAAVLAAATLGGVAEGALVGTVMHRLLRGWLPGLPAGRFVGVTVAVAVAGWLLGTLPSVLAAPAGASAAASPEPPLVLVALAAAAGGALAGAAFGAAQAAVLRGHVPHPWRWVTANAVAWLLGVAVVTVGASVVPTGWPFAALLPYGAGVGLLAGLAVGAVTGYAVPGLAVDGPRARRWLDRVVLEVLRGPAHGLLSGALLELRYTGPRTGRSYGLPLQYARHGDSLVLLPGQAHRKRWWRALGDRTPVAVVLDGHERTGRASVLWAGEQGYAAAFGAYRARYRRAKPGRMTPLVVVDLAAAPRVSRSSTGRSDVAGFR